MFRNTPSADDNGELLKIEGEEPLATTLKVRTENEKKTVVYSNPLADEVLSESNVDKSNAKGDRRSVGRSTAAMIFQPKRMVDFDPCLLSLNKQTTRRWEFKGWDPGQPFFEGDEEKNGHLKRLENATENLQLFKTDLLDYEGLCSATAGCTGVIHVACPVPYGPVSELEVLEPAITGTRNVLNACLLANVNKVVVVSSVSAVWLHPNWLEDQILDENSWSDIEHCKAKEMWYALGKTLSEREAVEFGKTNGLKIVTVCPSMVFGPMLQSNINASSSYLLNSLKGGIDTAQDKQRPFVDVRDAAEAILLVYEKPEAEGRYICSSYNAFVREAKFLAGKLKGLTEFNNPENFSIGDAKMKFCSDKLQKLGWKFRPLEETIADALQDLQEKGLLEK